MCREVPKPTSALGHSQTPESCQLCDLEFSKTTKSLRVRRSRLSQSSSCPEQDARANSRCVSHLSFTDVGRLSLSSALELLNPDEMSGCSQRRIGSPALGPRAVLWRYHVFAAASRPTIARHQSRSCFPGAAVAQFRKRPGVFSMSFFEAWAASRSSNQSLERTPVEQSCVASLVVCGRRSALRWATDNSQVCR